MTTQLCEWFALCDHPATGTAPHPVLGEVPICDRCRSRAEIPDRTVDAEARYCPSGTNLRPTHRIRTDDDGVGRCWSCGRTVEEILARRPRSSVSSPHPDREEWRRR